MLTLTRKNQQSILLHPSNEIDPSMTVGELFEQPLEIIVHRIKSGSVAISIDAPRALKVIRKELLEQ